MDIKEIDILGDDLHRHWYYISKGRALKSFLQPHHPRSILDVGAGSGIFSKILLRSTRAESAVCVDIGYDEERSEVYHHKRIEFKRSIDRSDADLALFMDVIEHVDDDVGLLRTYAEILAPGALVLITVPAFPFLFSGHDLFLEHKRRYTLPSLESTVRRAGLEVINSKYFFGLLFPVAAVQRLLNRIFLKSNHIEPKSALKKHTPLVNSILITINNLELLAFPYNRFVGLTIFCLTRTLACSTTRYA
jgi:SAM-dependent methyltransferase